MLLGGGTCVGLITHPECDVFECDNEVSIKKRPWPTTVCCAMRKQTCNNDYYCVIKFRLKFKTKFHMIMSRSTSVEEGIQ